MGWLIAVAVALVALGIGLFIYAVTPVGGWYFKATMTSLNGVMLQKVQNVEFGPFGNVQDCKQANDSLDAVQKTVCYRWP